MLACSVADARLTLRPRRATAGQPPQLRREGRWLVDPQGRVVIVHGLNLVWKHAPYVPPATRPASPRADARVAGAARVQRRPGRHAVGRADPGRARREDPAYVAQWQRVIDLLADARSIWMLLDVHQDQWHETYGGEGVPDWAVVRPPPYDLAAAGRRAVPHRLLDARGLHRLRQLLGRPATTC